MNKKIVSSLKNLVPRIDKFQIIALTFFLILNLIFLSIVLEKNEFSLLEVDVFFSFANKLIFDSAFLLFSLLILKFIFRTPLIAALFLTLSALLALADIFVYYFGNTFVEAHHFALITPYSISSFVPRGALLAVALVLILVFIVSYVGTKRVPFKNIFKQSLFWLFICIISYSLSVSGIFNRKKDEKFDRVITGFRNAQIIYASKNQQIAFLSDVVFPQLGKKIKMFSPATEKFVHDYDLFSENFKIEKDISKFQKEIDLWNLSIGKDDYEYEKVQRYKRVVYIFAESLSLEALPCHNPKLKSDFASEFFCKDETINFTFDNLYTVGSPTLQGLTVIFNSHPNYNIHEATGELNSLPKILEKNGFKSVFIRSASKYFANENLIFKNMGFSEIIGREDFFKDENLRKYIYGWGLEDRILYDKVVDYIDKNRDKKLFVSVLGTDSHPPHGQIRYKHLKYPPRPNLKRETGSKIFNWINSVDRMDFDIANFLKKLEERGLFDESTLIVISADHSCPLNNVSAKIPGHPKNNLAKIPVIFLSKRDLPPFKTGTLASQLDIAPTIFHLLGLPKVSGWWGSTLFNPNRNEFSVGFNQGFIYFSNGSQKTTINAAKPKNRAEEDFIKLFNAIFVDENLFKINR